MVFLVDLLFWETCWSLWRSQDPLVLSRLSHLLNSLLRENSDPRNLLKFTLVILIPADGVFW